jgi:hypothetical protein
MSATNRRRFLQAAALVTSVAAGAWLFFPQTANAATGPNADVMQLQGTQTPGAGSIDPRVGNVPQLKRPPLSAYNTYTLIGTTSLPAKMGLANSYRLKNGRTLQVTLVEVTKDNRYRVLTTISEANATVYLKKLEVIIGPNEPLFLGGQYIDVKDPDKGGLVLGITIRP